MKLASSVIYYWIQKKFPNSRHINPRERDDKLYDRPIFPGFASEMGEHIVVVPEGGYVQIDSPEPDFLPVFMDGRERGDFEHILLGGTAKIGNLFNVLQSIFDCFERWQESMEQAVNRSYSYDAIIASCDDILEDPMALSDDHFRYVSYSRRLARESGYEERFVEGGRYLPLDYINQLTAMPDYKPSEDFTEVYLYNGITNIYHINIFFQKHFVGRLALPYGENEAKNRYYRCVLAMVAVYVESLYSEMRSFWSRESASSDLSEMIGAILDGKSVEQNTFKTLLKRCGWQEKDRYSLIQMRSHFITNESKMARALTTQLEREWPGSCCLIYQQRLVVFLNRSHYSRVTGKLFNQELALFLRESLLLAGISRTFTDMSHICAAYRQTGIALDTGTETDPHYWYFKYDDYAYCDLLRHGCGDFLPEEVCHPAINILTAYDRENNTELCETLRTYMVGQYNAVSTAAALCVARSTFLKRLARIEELTAIDLTDFRTRMYLALSFELIRN